jgi:hypothetical protein
MAMVLLRGFIKKTQAAPKADLDLNYPYKETYYLVSVSISADQFYKAVDVALRIDCNAIRSE